VLFPDGRRIEGEFKNDKLYDRGILTDPDGRKQTVEQTGINAFKIVVGK
jgi:hypothetical protein